MGYSDLFKVTVINVSANDAKVAGTFSLIVILTSSMSFMMCFFYWKKSSQWKYRKHSHQEKFLDYDIALHSLMIEGIPKNIPYLVINEKFKNAFSKMFPADNPKVVNAKVIGKFDSVFKLC